MPRRGRATALLLLLLLLGACTDESKHPDAAPRSSSATAPTGSAGDASGSASSGSAGSEPSEPAGFPADTSPDGGSPRTGATADSTAEMRVAGLRTGEHPGYSRLVVELTTSAVPEWTVSYGEPTGPGGGPVSLSGDAFLRLSLHTQAQPDPASGRPAQTAGSGVIAQARVTGLFEGYEEVLVGVQGSQRPFRAFALTDPGRIVIDVAKP